MRERGKRPSPPGHIYSESLPVLSPAHQVEGLTKELTSIVDWFSQLQAIDVEGVPPALQADVDSQDWQRPDEPHTFENRYGHGHAAVIVKIISKSYPVRAGMACTQWPPGGWSRHPPD